MSADLAQLATDRYEIADALHRFTFGLDHGDADSLVSTLMEDCVLDFRPAGRKLGLDFPKLTGRQAIVDALIPLLGPLDTSHTISNLQIEISDDSATLYGYVLAQHFMPRQGPKPGPASGGGLVSRAVAVPALSRPQQIDPTNLAAFKAKWTLIGPPGP